MKQVIEALLSGRRINPNKFRVQLSMEHYDRVVKALQKAKVNPIVPGSKAYKIEAKPNSDRWLFVYFNSLSNNQHFCLCAKRRDEEGQIYSALVVDTIERILAG